VARGEIIAALEKALDCRLICYATGDRTGQETQIGEDAIPLLYEHLRSIGRVNRIGLMIYSRGGHTMAGFALGNALNEFAQQGVVALIPFRAHSCATLISLSAGQIVMGPFGQLSPIDPSITTPHGPYVEEGNQKKYIPVSVEDVAGYLSLAKDEAGVQGSQMVDVFGHLSQKVNPLALGAVFRSRQQIGMLAKKLLSRHMKDQEAIEKIVRNLTRELLSHDYVISRAEAGSLGLPVVVPDDDVAAYMWAFYEGLVDEMHLGTPWNPENELEGQQSVKKTVTRCIIESSGLKHVFVTQHELKRTQVVQGGMRFDGVQGKTVDEWRKA
jgi:hypothetical protein